MTGETIQLAQYAADLKFEDIPEAVRQRVRNTICDCVGAMIFGYELPWTQMVRDYATTYGPGGKSRILAAGAAPVRAPMAALANGTSAHAFELDGAVKPSVGVHPCATIFPAGLAIAQEYGFGGRNLMTAFVAAAEVMLRIGAATQHSNEIRGFHAPGTTGPFGAAMSAGRLLGLNGAQLTHALGIAASLSCGLVQFSRAGTGGMVKRLHFGRANESGVLAAELAKRGFDGPHDAIEGEFGFLRVYCNEWNMRALTEDLGKTFHSMNIYMKRYACHGAAQAPLQALEDLRAENKFSSDDVEAVTISGSHEMFDRHGDPHPKDRLLAQYSVPFSVALAMFRDARDPRSFDQSAVEDKKINELSARIKLGAAKDAEHMSPGATVVVMLKDGRRFEKTVVNFKGTPNNPADSDDVHEKYSLLTSHLPRAKMEEIFNRIQEIEKEENFDWLAL